MSQVSKPMQILLGVAVLFAVVYFVALRPKPGGSAEPAAAVPAASTPVALDAAGGAVAKTGLGKTIEKANNTKASSDAEATRESNTTADGANGGSASVTSSAAVASGAAGAAATKTTTVHATTPNGTTVTATKTTTVAAARAAAIKAKAAAAVAGVSHAQLHAYHVIDGIKGDLAHNRAVVFFFWSPSGDEDRMVHTIVTKQIDTHHGKVRVYVANVNDVGLYNGLIGDLPVAQSPSLLVIAPDSQTIVLGGLTSVARINRLTSAALLSHATKKKKTVVAVVPATTP